MGYIITASNWIYMEHAFGPGIAIFPDLEVRGTADAILIDELTHHGAEIALVRDLYLRRDA